MLNPYLARVGGHATEVLHRSLGLLHGLAVERALITCDQDNRSSATVIERCGRILQDVVDVDGVLKRRYWVDLVRA